MRPPNPRLTDTGSGPDVVTVYPLAFDQDAEGNEIRRPAAPGTAYPAVVDSTPGAEIAADGTALSVTVYTVFLHTTADPGVKNQDPVGWRGLTLQARSDAARCGKGSWWFNAAETGPADGAGGGYPAGLG